MTLSARTVKRLLAEVFGSQLAAARVLRFSDRGVRYWCQYGAPPHVAKILRQVEAGEISPQAAAFRLRTDPRGRLPSRVVAPPRPRRTGNACR